MYRVMNNLRGIAQSLYSIGNLYHFRREFQMAVSTRYPVLAELRVRSEIRLRRLLGCSTRLRFPASARPHSVPASYRS